MTGTLGVALLAAGSVLAGGAEIRPDWLILVDARDEVHYRHAHLPGAISIPAEDKPLRFVDPRRPERLLHPERLPADRARLLVFYCGGPN